MPFCAVDRVVRGRGASYHRSVPAAAALQQAYIGNPGYTANDVTTGYWNELRVQATNYDWTWRIA